MDIRFLNVGQGDSIILEWGDPEELCVGIVDCCLFEKSNPVVDYLSALKKFKIEFLLLSHPHKDHYSGFLELLYFIRDKGLKIKAFIHTMAVHPGYLKWAEIDSDDAILLENIFDMILSLRDKYMLIESIQYAFENWQLPLGYNLFLNSLSPSDEEVREFTTKIDYYSKDHWHICSSAANYLSTILMLEDINSHKSILLTSDAIDYSFKRLASENRNFNFFQIPHHGSVNSLHEAFWQKSSINEPRVGVISAGLHKKYNLPDYDVIKFFHELGINIKSTNYVNGMKEYYDSWNKKTHTKIKALDDFSEQLFYSFQTPDTGVIISI